MKIKEFYEQPNKLPNFINVIREEDKTHPYIGPYKTAPKWVKETEYESVAVITYSVSDKERVIFYIK